MEERAQIPVPVVGTAVEWAAVPAAAMVVVPVLVPAMAMVAAPVPAAVTAVAPEATVRVAAPAVAQVAGLAADPVAAAGNNMLWPAQRVSWPEHKGEEFRFLPFKLVYQRQRNLSKI
jgi:hypothetical protein